MPKSAFLLLTLTLVAACSSSPMATDDRVPVEVPATSTVAMAANSRPSFTPTRLALSRESMAVLMAAKSRPSSTPTQAPTPVSTPVPPRLVTMEPAASPTSATWSTPTPWPTPEHLAVPTIMWATAESPDGRWVARWGVSDGMPTDDTKSKYVSYRETALLAKDGSITLTLLSEWSGHGLGMPIPGFLSWSPDSAAAFVYGTYASDGCGSGGIGNLDRIDVPSGKRTRMADGADLAEISPDGLELALLEMDREHSSSVVIVDAVTGHRRLESDRFALRPRSDKGDSGGRGMHWSPDGLSLLVDVMDGFCFGTPFVATARIDAQTGAVTVAREVHPGSSPFQ